MGVFQPAAADCCVVGRGGRGGGERAEQSKLTHMQELFHRFDSQRKGTLAGFQFRKVVEGLGVKLEDWEFAVMLKRFDGDGDG